MLFTILQLANRNKYQISNLVFARPDIYLHSNGTFSLTRISINMASVCKIFRLTFQII